MCVCLKKIKHFLIVNFLFSRTFFFHALKTFVEQMHRFKRSVVKSSFVSIVFQVFRTFRTARSMNSSWQLMKTQVHRESISSYVLRMKVLTSRVNHQMISNYLRMIIITNRLKFEKTSNCSLRQIDLFSRKISRFEALSHSKKRANSNSERD